jgi:hypothetical protein
MGETRQGLLRKTRVRGAAVALSWLVAAPAHATAAAGPYSKTIELPAREIHEECIELAAGQRLAYTYSARSTVPFNIHYHVGDKIAYPVRKNARHVRAVYVPHRAQGYCMMWTNPRAKPLALEYSFEVGAAPPPK